MWTIHAQADSQISIGFLLSVFAVSLILTTKFAMQLVFGSHHSFRVAEHLSGILASLIGFWLAFDAICFLQQRSSRDGDFAVTVWGVATICLAAIAAWLYLRFSRMQLSAKELLCGPTVWILLVCSISATTWSGFRFYESTGPTLLDTNGRIPPGQFSQVTEFVAITDRGRRIPLMKWEVDKEKFLEFDFELMYAEMTGAGALIPRALPDAQSNCHGWVFTGGGFHLTGSVVEQILEDNNYRAVDDPQSDDLVVYRTYEGDIVHTGLVRGVLDDGTVIVESKWDLSGRFLHRPEDQPYSQHFGYYRSSRLWHLVTIVPVPFDEIAEIDANNGESSSGANRGCCLLFNFDQTILAL